MDHLVRQVARICWCLITFNRDIGFTVSQSWNSAARILQKSGPIINSDYNAWKEEVTLSNTDHNKVR